MSLSIKREITIGQAVVLIVSMIAFVGAAWTTYAEVQEMKKDAVTFASLESVTALRQDLTEIRQDLGDIKILVFYYVRQQTQAKMDSTFRHPVQVMMNRIDSTLNSVR
jgi:hypothetical protein